ncbi:MAG: RNA polymerase sigma factor [Ruminococcus sp.]|nr:RNA polymerase sigma factor [Ruminococcus sp.]
MNDASIIELLWKRDENAISEMKQSYERLCFHVAGGILSQQEDCEECVNSAYMDVWRSIPPNRPASLKNYICRLVKNAALNILRRNTADKRSYEMAVSLDELSECIADGSSIEDSIAAEQLGAEISRFLKGQPEKYRKVFVRRYWYSESIEEVADFFGMNEKTVATYLFRVRKKLKEHLQKEGYINE